MTREKKIFVYKSGFLCFKSETTVKKLNDTKKK